MVLYHSDLPLWPPLDPVLAPVATGLFDPLRQPETTWLALRPLPLPGKGESSEAAAGRGAAGANLNCLTCAFFSFFFFRQPGKRLSFLSEQLQSHDINLDFLLDMVWPEGETGRVGLIRK